MCAVSFCSIHFLECNPDLSNVMSHCRFFVIRSLQISSGMQGRNTPGVAIDRMMNVLVIWCRGWFPRFSTRPDLFLVNRYWCLRVTDVILSGVFHHSRCTYCVKLDKQFRARKYIGREGKGK